MYICCDFYVQSTRKEFFYINSIVIMKTFGKSLFLFLSCAFIETLPAQEPVNVFREGTVWVTEYTSLYDPDIEYEIMSIEGEEQVGERLCMNLWRGTSGGGKQLYAYLYTEGEKVFFIRPEDTTQSYLFYDFGMESGQKVAVVPFVKDIQNYWEEEHFYQRSDESYELQNCGYTYTVMNMKECHDQYEGDTDPWVSTHKWIKGIGSTNGLLRNCGWGDMAGAPSGLLTNVIVDGETIYSLKPYQPNGIEEFTSESVRPVRYYDLQGRPIAPADALRSGCIFILRR